MRLPNFSGSTIVTRNIIENPRLSNSKEIKIESKNADIKVPVTVSGDNGVRIEGLFDPNFSLLKEGHTYILNNPTIYADTVNFGTRDGTTTSTNTNIISNQGVSDNSTFNNISYILEQVNSSPHSTEEKEEIKNILEELNKELSSKPPPSVLESLKKKLRIFSSCITFYPTNHRITLSR